MFNIFVFKKFFQSGCNIFKAIMVVELWVTTFIVITQKFSLNFEQDHSMTNKVIFNCVYQLYYISISSNTPSEINILVLNLFDIIGQMMTSKNLS